MRKEVIEYSCDFCDFVESDDLEFARGIYGILPTYASLSHEIERDPGQPLLVILREKDESFDECEFHGCAWCMNERFDTHLT